MARSFFIFSFLLLTISSLASLLEAQSTVNFLPGFQGSLPFHLETGYIGVGESEDVQLFYYFVKSERNPKKDPLLLWLTGGPGCSVFSAFAYEIGPLYFKINAYDDAILPSLILNPYAWTKVSNIIFVDSPVGTGFSYATTTASSHSNDRLQAIQLCEFFRKWMKVHPEFISNTVYLGGDSYSGVILPPLFLHIIEGNDAGIKPTIHLKGYLLGNPKTDELIDGNSKITFAHGMSLISNELYEAIWRNCKGNIVNIDPRNTFCLENVKAYNQSMDGIFINQILEPYCPRDYVKSYSTFKNRRYLNSRDLQNPSEAFCRNSGYLLSKDWMNSNMVREALYIRNGSIGEWVRCNYKLPYAQQITSAIPYHASITSKGFKSLIYSGDHDGKIPIFGTEKWIKSLNYSIVDEWRSWKVNIQIAGYTRKYSNEMTFATVKGGGHTAPEYKPEQCFAMFKRWISNKPL